jgi:hypothetical protein
MGQQYIFTTSQLTKKYGQREVLKDLGLCVYPGA